MADFDLTAFYGQFRDETLENLDIVDQGLMALEAQPEDKGLLDQMLRAIHTAKGSAKIMGFSEINLLAHDMEEVLGAIRKEEIELTPKVSNLLLQANAAIRTLTEAVVEGQQTEVDVSGLLKALRQMVGLPEEAPAAAPAEKPAPAKPLVTLSAHAAGRPRETIRVDLERVDQLARLVGETLALQQQALEEQSVLQDLSWIHEEAWLALSKLKERLLAHQDRLRPLQAEEVFQGLRWAEAAIQKLQEQWRDFRRQHGVLLETFSLALDELYQEALTIRMLPIGTIFEIFPGVVRRMAGESGVEVTLEVRGAEVELDRHVLDLLREPLIHLMRNALDHGIEPPREREHLGKPRRGRIILEAWQLGRRVHIRIQDDGRGIDQEQVRRTVVRRGILDEAQAQEADEKTLLNYLFQPGFTTRRRATDISGRGVGLDAVQTAIRQLNGIVQVDTQAGQGTTFTLNVPLTLATIRVLLVEVAGENLAIPGSAVRSLTRIQPQEVVSVEGRPTLQWSGRQIPVISLAESLGFVSESVPSTLQPAIITGSNGYQVALSVDRVIDEAEVVVQSLDEILGTSPYFSAATLSGKGRVVPILDLTALLTLEQPASRVADRRPLIVAPPRETPVILLVEDTIITRELERSILESAGYQVETAFDGIDALQKLERQDFHLVITDIEMPRMDGFELTRRLRQSPRWETLPVVIVTAREDEAGRRRGLGVGAQAYIVKSRFDQSNLLDTIAQLVGS